MSDAKKEIDQDKGDEVLKRMLKTRPKPHGNTKTVKSENKDRSSDSRRSSTN